jgi:8-oxo-dGTP diphosphatase
MSEPPIPHAIVAVVRRGDRVLLIRRGPGAAMSGYWAPPSGRVEPGESQADAVVRELREELGADATPLRKVWESATHDGGFRLHWWLAEVPGDAELRLDRSEVSEARWVTPEEFRQLDRTFESHAAFFERVLPGLE